MVYNSYFNKKDYIIGALEAIAYNHHLKFFHKYNPRPNVIEGVFFNVINKEAPKYFELGRFYKFKSKGEKEHET